MDLSKNIRTKREEFGLTQLEMAERLETERSNYARLESRGNDLTLNQLINISTALGITLLELLYPTDDIKPQNYDAIQDRMLTELAEEKAKVRIIKDEYLSMLGFISIMLDKIPEKILGLKLSWTEQLISIKDDLKKLREQISEL